MKLSIRQGLLLFLMLASPMLISVVGLGLWGTWRSQDLLQQVLVKQVEPVQDLILIDKQIARVRVRMYGVLNDDIGAEGARIYLAQARRDIIRGWQAYRAATEDKTDQGEQVLIDTIEPAIAELPALLDRLDGFLAGNDRAAINHLLKEDWWAVQLQVVTPVGKLIDLQKAHVAAASARAQEVFRETLLGTGLLLLAGLLSFFWFSRRLFTHVTEKLDVIEAALTRIARGDLETRIGGSHRGEFGRIVVALDLAADKLSRKEEELRSVVDHLRDGVITIDASGMIRSANPAICTIFRQPANALQDEDLRMLIPPDYRAAHAQGLARHAATGDALALDRLVELEGLRSDGSRFPIELSINAYAVRGERFYSGIIRDISDRKQAEATLHQALEQAQEYLDVALAVMVVIDCDLSVRLINRAGCALLGLSESEIVGSNWFDRFIPAPERESLRSSFLNWLAGTPSGVIAAHNHNDILTADGRVRRVAWSNALLRDESGTVTGNLSSGIDVTDQHAGELELHATIERLTELNRKLEQAQSQLLQSEKMASIGQLAAGVAHEINNPVGFVNSNLGSLRDEVHDLLRVIDAYAAADPVLAEHSPALMDTISQARDAAELDYLRDDVGTLIDESLDGLQRVRRIVQDLKDFSRVDTSEWQFADLEAGLESTFNIVWNEIKYKAEVHKEYAGIPEVECIAAQVNQVFLNLLVNAAQAIEGRGTIILRSGADDREAWIEVEDSGRGIAPEHLTRLFEPFFTTKPVGQGTGLGLSLAYSIAQRHGGRLEVSSQIGVGSKFRLTLPLRRAPSAALAVADASQPA